MNRFIEEIYYRLPYQAQNLAVSTLGIKLLRERYHKQGKLMLNEIMETKDFQKNEMEDYVERKFIEIARHAISNVPFYIDWSRKQGINKKDINSIKDIDIFPAIEKQFLRENYLLFVDKNIINAKGTLILETSGTTGTPLKVFTDAESRSRHYAFFTRLRSIYGLTHKSKRATLFGRIIMRPEAGRPPFWRYDYFNNNLLFSSYHLKENNLHHYYKQLVKYGPDEIFSYPSSILPIADYILRNNLSKISLKLLMTTAEHLSQAQEDMLRKAFDGPIVNQYGCTEMAFFATKENENFFFHPEHGISEVRTESGHIQNAGTGELIATGLINKTMPVIRYVVGDQISLSERDTRGRVPINNLIGRIDDVIYSTTGAPVGRLDPIFKGGSGIKYAQIYQDEKGLVELRIVPDSTYKDLNGENLLYELKKRVGDDTPTKLVILNSLDKGKNGKFRPVISQYRPR